MKTLIALSFLLALTACGSIPSNNFNADLMVDEVNVTWLVVRNADRTCRNLSPELDRRYSSHSKIQACANFDLVKQECTIYTNRTLNDTILAHEIRHCFQGAWHH